MYSDMRLYPGSQNYFFLFLSSADDHLLSEESRCMKFCEFEEKISGGLMVHKYCCDYENFCNDVDLPITLP